MKCIRGHISRRKQGSHLPFTEANDVFSDVSAIVVIPRLCSCS